MAARRIRSLITSRAQATSIDQSGVRRIPGARTSRGRLLLRLLGWTVLMACAVLLGRQLA